MPIFQIHRLDDPRLEAYRNLKVTSAARRQRTFIAEGEKLVVRLLESGLGVESVLVDRRHLERLGTLVPADAEVLVVPDDAIEAIIGFNFHRGVLACGRRPANRELPSIVQAASGPLTIIACPAIHDPENLGALLRISSAFGVAGVLLGSDCCDPFSRRVLRVSMGASFRVPIRESASLDNDLQHLKREHGFELWAAVTDLQATPIDQANRPQRVALLLGSEGHGLAPHWLAACERQVTIPMQAGVDSLNVSVAAGILLYGLARSGG